MIRRILVGLDKSTLGEQVLQKAIALARRYGAALKILHSLTDSEPEAPKPTFHLGEHYDLATDQALIAAYQRDWNDYVDQHRIWLEQQVAIAAEAGLNTTYELVYGLPGRQICDWARSWQADLIAVGNRGRIGLSELLLGSVSNYVMHRAPCSVVVIHPQKRPAMASQKSNAPTPQRILVPIDRSDAATEVVQDATALAKAYGADVRLLHVLVDGEPGSPDLAIFDSSYYIANSQLTEQYHHAWNKFVNDWWIYLRSQATDITAAGVTMVSYDVVQGEAGPKICQAAKDWNADLIVMGSRGLSTVKQLLLGSTSQHVTHRAPCSVWVTHTQIAKTSTTATTRDTREPIVAR